MDALSLVCDLVTPVTALITVIWYFATKGSKQDTLQENHAVLTAIIKENHDSLSKKIELASIEASHMRTEIELMKLRVDMLERENDKRKQ